MRQHVVLVGLPGSGKTSVGPLVAQQLGTSFVDIDAIIVRREGRPVAVIFAEQGEAAFRDIERRAVRSALEQEPSIVAPGGGWAAQPGAMDEARGEAFIVYLRTRPETAIRRAPGNRPTLMGGDPGDRMRDLLEDRETFYLQAHATVDTDGKTVTAVAEEVVRLARARAGW